MNCRNHIPAHPSLRSRLILLVCIVTLIPFAIGQIISNRRLLDVVNANSQEQERLTLQQSAAALDASCASYEDFLYQLYTDDTIVALIDKLIAQEDPAVCHNQLRREIQGRVSGKPYLQAITLILEDGSCLYYDKLTASSSRSSWLDAWDTQAMYQQVADSNATRYYPSAYAMDVSGEPTWLFHVAHRLIDYRHIEKKTAIVVLSIDQAMLFELCNKAWRKENTSDVFTLLTTSEGQIVSAPQDTLIGETFSAEADPDFASAHGLLKGEHLSTSSILNERTGWTLYQFRDQSPLYAEVSHQQRFTLWIMLGSVLLLIVAICWLIHYLSRSIGLVADTMQHAGSNLSLRVPVDAHMPQETVLIADRFNQMMDEMNGLLEQVRTTSEQKKDAEIAMLEAQINPHFLYNTLDTINWMAIDQDQFDISNAITSLARILRYGIDGSNRIVRVRDELEWLRQYLNLQQIRLKNSLHFELDAAEDTLELPIHKLLFQPFVENAIIHGFDGVKRVHQLHIVIRREADGLHICIADNGKGMTREQVAALDCPDQDKHHIGVSNAMNRLRMYYGNEAQCAIKSELDRGTTIELLVPLKEGANG